MLNEIEIKNFIKEVLKKELPQWKREYYAKICEKLQVHTKGLLFNKIDTLFPNEHPDSKAHCINTYEPITKGSIWKAINNINRIFCNSGFSISASDNTLHFINENRFENKTLFSFFIEKWINETISIDPNSFLAIYPVDYNTKNIVKFISSEYLLHKGDDFISFISEEESLKDFEVENNIVAREVFYDNEIQSVNSRKSVKETYNQKVKTIFRKKVIHVFTKDFLLVLTPDEKNVYDYRFFYFKNELTKIPVKQVSSNTLLLDINESFVEPFIPFGNLALLQHRNHRAVDLMFSYPRMSEIQTPCDNLVCHGGTVADLEDPLKRNTCNRCNGSGFVTVQSPYKVYQKKIDTGLSDVDTVKALLSSSPVDFHTPDVSILNYSKDVWKDYLALAEESVFVQQKQKTGNVESAKAKEEDKEAQYSWVLNIHKAMNKDLLFVISIIEEYLNSNVSEISVEQPISFALVTETEAFSSLELIISSEAPVFVKSQQVENFLHRFVSKSNPVVKAFKVLKLVDPLLFYSNKDLQNFKSNNAITLEAYTVHIYAYMLLMQMYEADKTLFEKPEQEIVSSVKDKIAELLPKSIKSLKENIADAI